MDFRTSYLIVVNTKAFFLVQSLWILAAEFTRGFMEKASKLLSYDHTLTLQVGKFLGFNPTVCTGVGCYDEPSLSSIYANHPKHSTQLLLHRLTGSCLIECCNNISKVVRAIVFRHTGSTASAPLTILKVWTGGPPTCSSTWMLLCQTAISLLIRLVCHWHFGNVTFEDWNPEWSVKCLLTDLTDRIPRWITYP